MKRIFSGASSLNTQSDPARISFDPETGVSDLHTAVDVKIESSGRVTRRKGYSLLHSGNFHSLYCNGGECYVGKDGHIYQVLEDLTLRGVRSGLTGNRIGFSDMGDGRTLYGNGTQNGQIIDSVSSAWPTQTSYIQDFTNEVFSGAPVGAKICFHRGRAYVVDAKQPNVLYASERFQFGLFSMASNHWKFESEILMLAPVESGIFISTKRRIYFFRTTGERVQLERKTNYPAMEWSAAHDQAEGTKLGLQSPGLCAMWLAKTGGCVGLPDGSVVNMTEGKVALSASQGPGASLLYDSYMVGSYQNCPTMCVNIERGGLTEKATTQFTNFRFNSYCNFNGYALAASSSGLYKMGGATDNGTDISGYFAPILTDFGDPHPKRLWSLYFGLESELDLQITVTTDEGCSTSINLSPTKTTQSRRRVRVPSNLSGRWWSIKVENLLGGDFSIDTIDVEYIKRTHGIVNG